MFVALLAYLQKMSCCFLQIFFAVHLFREQIFSMSDHLERILKQFLKCLRCECISNLKRRKYKSHAYNELFRDWAQQPLTQYLCALQGSCMEYQIRTQFAGKLTTSEITEMLPKFRQIQYRKAIAKTDEFVDGEMREMLGEDHPEMPVHQSLAYTPEEDKFWDYQLWCKGMNGMEEDIRKAQAEAETILLTKPKEEQQQIRSDMDQLTFSTPPDHPLFRIIAPHGIMHRLHDAVQRCALARQANEVRFP